MTRISDQTGQPTQEHPSSLREEAMAVKEDLNTLKNDAVSFAKTGADATWDAARNAADKVRDAHGKLCEGVASRPTTSILVALGIGVVCGRLLARR